MNKMVRAGLLLKALLTLTVGAFTASTALADEMAMPQASPAEATTAAPIAEPATVSASPAGLPKRGETMSQVVRQFGQPATKHAAVGGDSPHHPPITRWDYPGFSVFFEHDHVVDAVIPGQPPTIRNTDQLQPAAN
jgi:hypothetical protein